ncbi:ATP-binding protein [Streptomyces pathocidini]|uniref:ATP-binding protein n=1 Tax=Streptomyces pathocidini TaxID=1650571 RepID=A0ABW7US81_9ACTN
MTSEPPQTPAWDYTLHIPHDPLAPRIARRTLRTILAAYEVHELTDTAELLTSELVTNAHRYARGPASVRIRRDGKRLRVSVWDTDPALPNLTGGAAPDPDDERGRGLGLIRSCADDWGGFTLGETPFGGLGGKLLWFELGAARHV